MNIVYEEANWKQLPLFLETSTIAEVGERYEGGESGIAFADHSPCSLRRGARARMVEVGIA
jgi:hypothetical protein